MPIVEKNDVDISSLFLWSKQSFITGLKGKEIKVYIRLLGDADINRARVMALRKSAELRRSLREPDSDDNLAYVPQKIELTKEVMVESIIMYTLRDITKGAMQDVVLKRPKDPGSDATTEQMEKFQKEVDEYPKLRETAIKDLMDKRVQTRREELSGKDEDTLYREYQNALINDLCETELLQRFKEACVFFGTFKDKKFTTRFFSEYSELDNLPSDIKDSLINDYSSLEIEADNLKK
jgi:hypothetical protein